MRKPLILLLSFFVFNLILISLNSCRKQYTDDGCGGSHTTTICADVNDIVLKTYRSGFDTLKSGEYGRQYAIVATYDVTQTVCFRINRETISLINVAYACTPPPPSFHFNDAIAEVTIITQNDFDSTHAAGTDITEYFTLPDYATDEMYEEYDEDGRVGSHAFFLEYLPTKEGTYRFTFRYRFASGRTVEKKDILINIRE